MWNKFLMAILCSLLFAGHTSSQPTTPNPAAKKKAAADRVEAKVDARLEQEIANQKNQAREIAARLAAAEESAGKQREVILDLKNQLAERERQRLMLTEKIRKNNKTLRCKVLHIGCVSIPKELRRY